MMAVQIRRWFQAAVTRWFALTMPTMTEVQSMQQRERRRKAQMLSIGIFISALLGQPSFVTTALLHSLSGLLINLLYLVALVVIAWLNHHNRCNLANALYIIDFILCSLGEIWIIPNSPGFDYQMRWVILLLPPIFSGLLLPYWTPIVFAILDSTLLTLLILSKDVSDPQNMMTASGTRLPFFLFIYVMMSAVGIISYISARSNEQALIEADRAGELAQAHAELARAYAHMEELATHDPTTKLFNHHALDERLAQEIATATREGYPLGIIFADLDHFKRINDTWGHHSGDQALVHLAQCLREQARAGDTIARFGGEEFVILLPRQDLAAVTQMAERIRHTIETTPMLLADDAAIAMTISLGVAIFPHDGRTAEDVLAAADAAMYVAKSSGRNRVCVAQQSHRVNAA